MHKLKKRSQFQKVYKEGKFLKGDNIALSFLLNNLGYNRIGISVNPNKAPLSVRRNRCRRLLLESYRLTENLLKNGYDIILIVKKDISNSYLDNVRDEILSLYKRCEILR